MPCRKKYVYLTSDFQGGIIEKMYICKIHSKPLKVHENGIPSQFETWILEVEYILL